MRTITGILAIAIVPVLLAQSSPSYRITHAYTIGGDGGWDYIVPDPPNHRLFIGRQDRVMVVDENNGALLGEVKGIRGAHGTAVASSSGHGFATSGNDQSVVMFDLKTYAVLGRIPAPRRGRDHLRRGVEQSVHVQRRRAFVDGDRSAAGHADHEHPARWQARIRRAGRRRQGLREPH
jgi:hypothetical protein